jgi:hypothetical protein
MPKTTLQLSPRQIQELFNLPEGYYVTFDTPPIVTIEGNFVDPPG